MHSLFRMDKQFLPENMESILQLYQTCLNEFESLGYEDGYVQEIRADIARIKAIMEG